MNKVNSTPEQTQKPLQPSDSDAQPTDAKESLAPKELNGPKGPEPTRFGDWERKGRCIDF